MEKYVLPKQNDVIQYIVLILKAKDKFELKQLFIRATILYISSNLCVKVIIQFCIKKEF